MKNKVPSGADWAFMTNAQLIDEFKIRRGEMKRDKKKAKRAEATHNALQTAQMASEDLQKPDSKIRGLLSLFRKGDG